MMTRIRDMLQNRAWRMAVLSLIVYGTTAFGFQATSAPSKAILPAQRTTTAPTSGPAASQPASQPANSSTLNSGDPAVDELLDRLEIKGKVIKGLACQITYKYIMVEPVEEQQIKEGRLLFTRAEPNSHFLIHFSKMIADGIVSPRGERFVFDGQWLTERNDKAKTIIRRQIVRPGEKVDPFKLGKGPFPLPFGQQRGDILRNFKVKLAPFELGDPRNSAHLHCVPLPDTELASKYTRVEIYVDRTLELPVRIITERVSDGNRIEVDFSDINVNEAPALSRFQVKDAGERLEDYTVTEEPLPSGEPPQ